MLTVTSFYTILTWIVFILSMSYDSTRSILFCKNRQKRDVEQTPCTRVVAIKDSFLHNVMKRESKHLKGKEVVWLISRN